MDVLTRIGLVELAFGALLGWAVTATMITPQLVERVGVRKPRRILQAHLDYDEVEFNGQWPQPLAEAAA